MKNSIFLHFIIALISFTCLSQTVKGIDYISPFHDGLAAVKKGNMWGFINTEGDLVINFRDDLVTTDFKSQNYPIFKNNRCLISDKKEGITYFGYINKSGETIIKPVFLNASNFKDDTALVILVVKDTIGHNNILNKTVISHNYFEVLINTEGETTHYLTPNPKHITLSKNFVKQPPQFTTQLLSDNLFAVWTEDEKWVIKKLE
jgi:hypothetical protein